MIYIVITFFLLICSILEICKLRSYFVGFIFIVFLSLLAGFREYTGSDYKTYLMIWEYTNPLTNTDNFSSGGLELGFIFLMTLLKEWSESEIVFFLCFASLSMFTLYFSLFKNNKNYICMSLLIYFMVFYIPYVFNGMRQAIAMSFFLLSIPYILQRKMIIVFILSIIAGLFHSSGFLILIAYLCSVYNPKISSYVLIGLGISSFLTLSNLTNIIFFNLLGINYEVYGEIFYQNTSLFQIITRSILFILFLFFYNKINDSYKILFRIYALGFFMYIMLFDYNMLATRFNMFFRVLEIILVPMVVSGIKRVELKILVLFIFLIPFGYSFYQSINFEDNIYHSEFYSERE